MGKDATEEQPSEKGKSTADQTEKDVKVVVMRLILEFEAKKLRMIVPSRDIIAVKGNGNTNMFCGKCKNFLAREVRPEQIKGVVIQCFKCKSYNVFP
jgi:hypothetical protein